MLKSAYHFYLVGGIKCLLKAIAAKLTHRRTLLTLKRSDCAHPIKLRYPSSDPWIYADIFTDKEYEFTANIEPKIIIDAGANIGLASIYFANKYPNAKIIAIEPEQNNYNLLVENTAPYNNIETVHAALWNKNESINIIDPGLNEWGFMTTEGDDTSQLASHLKQDFHQTVAAKTVDQIMADANLDQIDILKIDIEGAEKEVFSTSELWIDKIQMLIVELHEHMKPGCNEAVFNAVGTFKERWTKGENLYLLKEK